MNVTFTAAAEFTLIITSAIATVTNFISSREMAKTNSRFKLLETKFSSLHTKRSDIIAELYKRLVNLQFAMSDYAAVGRIIYEGQDKDAMEKQRASEAITTYNEYFDYLTGNRLYFDKDLAYQLTMIAHNYRMNLFNFHAYIVQKKLDNEDVDELKAARKKVEVARQAILNEIPKAIEAIEVEFKAILGVEETK